MEKTDSDRFWAKVDKTAPGTCWIWQGALNDGYGRIWLNGKLVASHRLSVEMSGRTIPDHMVVDHVCRNRACVNPEHLRIVTRFANVHENSQAVCHLKSLQTHCVNGHELTGSNLRPHTHRRSCRECEREWQRSYRRKQGLRAKHESVGRNGIGGKVVA